MKRLTVLTLGMLLAMSLPFTAADADDEHSLHATWELNTAKSKFDPGPAPKSQTRTYQGAGDEEMLESSGTDAKGKPTAVHYKARYDGKDYPVTGLSSADTISLRRIDESTTESRQKKAGKETLTTTRKVSSDGKMLTATSKGTNAEGKPTHNVMVFDRRE